MSVHGALGHRDIRATFKGCHIGHVVYLLELSACVEVLWFKERVCVPKSSWVSTCSSDLSKNSHCPISMDTALGPGSEKETSRCRGSEYHKQCISSNSLYQLIINK